MIGTPHPLAKRPWREIHTELTQPGVFEDLHSTRLEVLVYSTILIIGTMHEIESLIDNLIDESAQHFIRTQRDQIEGPMGGLVMMSLFANTKESLLENEKIPYQIVGLTRSQFEEMVESAISKAMNKYLDFGGTPV